MRIFLLMVLLLTGAAFPQDVLEIVRKAEDSIKGSSAHGTVEMTVVTPDYTRTMVMESWWVGNEKALIIIKSPKKEAGNKTLKIGPEMWNYLKNTETTIKIPPSMMLQSWNGSDFTNDDLVRESNLYEDYTLQLDGEVVLDGNPCWKVILTPKPDAPVVWGKLHYWIRKDKTLPAQINYYDEKGELIRCMTFSEIKKMGSRTVPTKWSMINLQNKGRHTDFRLLDMIFDAKIPERIFSFRELERGR